jgi:hypothetical protein
VAAVLVLVAALASYLPARWAARTEPHLALRGEAEELRFGAEARLYYTL